jgi:hypothetical protein
MNATLSQERPGPAFASKLRREGMMRITLNIVASLLVLSGATWFLQGISLLPGSFMTGQIRWAVYGGIAVAAGIALLLRANWPRKSP